MEIINKILQEYPAFKDAIEENLEDLTSDIIDNPEFYKAMCLDWDRLMVKIPYRYYDEDGDEDFFEGIWIINRKDNSTVLF